MLGVLPFVEDPDLSWSGAPALPQHLPPWVSLTLNLHPPTVEWLWMITLKIEIIIAMIKCLPWLWYTLRWWTVAAGLTRCPGQSSNSCKPASRIAWAMKNWLTCIIDEAENDWNERVPSSSQRVGNAPHPVSTCHIPMQLIILKQWKYWIGKFINWLVTEEWISTGYQLWFMMSNQGYHLWYDCLLPRPYQCCSMFYDE